MNYEDFITQLDEDKGKKKKPNALPHTVATIIKTLDKGGKGIDILKGFEGRFDPSQLGRSGRLEI